MEDKLKERLLDIVKECQTQLFSMFQGLENSSPNRTGSATLPVSVVSADRKPSVGHFTRAADDTVSDVFEGFDNLPVHTTTTPFMSPPLDSDAIANAAKLPTSSSSSDSGYDSTWPQSRALESNTDTSDTNLTLPGNFDHNAYIDMGNCFGLLEHQLDTIGNSSDVLLDIGGSTWDFIEPIQGNSDTNGIVHRSLEDLAPGWNL